jgi:hypothetical protein
MARQMKKCEETGFWARPGVRPRQSTARGRMFTFRNIG